MSEPLTYIKHPEPPEVVEAMYVDQESYQAVALWMGFKDIRSDGKDGWVLVKPNLRQHLTPNTYIVDKSQTMSPKDFKKTYKLWPKDLL